jgi:hypothetical protein
MSFRVVEVDNDGFQILDEDGNVVSTQERNNFRGLVVYNDDSKLLREILDQLKQMNEYLAIVTDDTLGDM